jgi:capsid portal protein
MNYEDLMPEEKLKIMEFVADIITRVNVQSFEIGAAVYGLPNYLQELALIKLAEYVSKRIEGLHPHAKIQVSYLHLIG